MILVEDTVIYFAFFAFCPLSFFSSLQIWTSEWCSYWCGHRGWQDILHQGCGPVHGDVFLKVFIDCRVYSWQMNVCYYCILNSVSLCSRQQRLTSSWTLSVSTRLTAMQWKRCWRSPQCCTVLWKPSRWLWETKLSRTTASSSLTLALGWGANYAVCNVMPVLLNPQSHTLFTLWDSHSCGI